jgi:hypothetical protein
MRQEGISRSGYKNSKQAGCSHMSCSQPASIQLSFYIICFSTVQMSLRGGFLLFPTKQSPVLMDILVQKEIASPPNYKSGGSQRHQYIRCTVEEFSFYVRF